MRGGPPVSRGASATRRCAVYTRKSSEEGLEQAFNSLDAQREACEAYIRSQRHEGWTALATRYDDGGLSGGTLERPALRHLLADIRAGRLDLVVVYKVDRLTRSLADFAKIVEIFDAGGVSFVSVMIRAEAYYLLDLYRERPRVPRSQAPRRRPARAPRGRCRADRGPGLRDAADPGAARGGAARHPGRT